MAAWSLEGLQAHTTNPAAGATTRMASPDWPTTARSSCMAPAVTSATPPIASRARWDPSRIAGTPVTAYSRRCSPCGIGRRDVSPAGEGDSDRLVRRNRTPSAARPPSRLGTGPRDSSVSPDVTDKGADRASAGVGDGPARRPGERPMAVQQPLTVTGRRAQPSAVAKTWTSTLSTRRMRRRRVVDVLCLALRSTRISVIR